MSKEQEGYSAPPPYPGQGDSQSPPPGYGYNQPPAQGYPQQPGYPTQPVGYSQPVGYGAPAGYTAVTIQGQPGITYAQPGMPGTVVVAAQPGGPVPDNHMCLAIFTTLCCFWPLGILAIIKSSEVNSKYSVGDVQGANRASAQSRQFSMIAIGIGIAAYIICGIILGIYIGVLTSV